MRERDIVKVGEDRLGGSFLHGQVMVRSRPTFNLFCMTRRTRRSTHVFEIRGCWMIHTPTPQHQDHHSCGDARRGNGPDDAGGCHAGCTNELHG
jgi:hypothetical protein